MPPKPHNPTADRCVGYNLTTSILIMSMFASNLSVGAGVGGGGFTTVTFGNPSQSANKA